MRYFNIGNNSTKKNNFMMNSRVVILIVAAAMMLLSIQSTAHQVVNGEKNILILSLPFPGHIRPHVELIEVLSNSPTVSNITVLNDQMSLHADPRLKKWASQTNSSGVADRKVHISLMESGALKSETHDYSHMYKELSKMRGLNVQDQFKLVFEKLLIPYELLMVQQLEIVEVLHGKIVNVVSLEARLEKLASSPQIGVKRFLRIRNDPSETLFDSVVVDFALISIQSLVAGGKIPCTKIFAAHFRQFVFHYPSLSVSSMDYFTSYPQRLIMPFLAIKDLFIISTHMNSPLGNYFSLSELGLSDSSCAIIQTTSYGFEHASSNTQQYAAHLVGPFMNEKHIENEIQQLKEMASTTADVVTTASTTSGKSKWGETSGFNGLFEWVDEQQDIMLLILGSSMVLDEKIMVKLVNGFLLALQDNPKISIICAFGHINMDLFDNLTQTNSPLAHNLLANKRFKLLKGFVPQKGLMSLEKVKIFFTHCGANSVNEALYFGKLLIGFPFAFDQYRVAENIEDFKLGRSIYKSAMESKEWKHESISHAIHELLYNENTREMYKTKIRHTKALMRRSGGVKRAAEIVELVSEVDGDLSWAIADKHLTWWQFYCLDLLIVYGLVVCLAIKLSCLACSCGKKVKKE